MKRTDRNIASMADDSVYCGTWRIVKCSALMRGVESSGIEGTEFTLDESGDVTWNIPENTEPMPFFNCETYEMYLSDPHYLRFFGTFVGHVIEFRVDQPKEDTITLTYNDWCVLWCEKVMSGVSKHNMPFSFMSALEEHYFSDLSVFASSGKEFKVHKTILKLGNPLICWDQSPCALDGLPEDVLYTTLHYLYCECLPADLQEDTARSCLTHVSKLQGFKTFQEFCELFLKNSALKQQIITLVTEMHTCANHIIDYFSGKRSGQDSPQSATANGPLTNGVVEGDNLSLASNPAKLCYVIKQALRESAVAGAKILILCDLFSRRKNELSREERHEIIKYCKSRLPIFMNQFHKLLDVIKLSFGNLTASERMEIASYLVPEIEMTLDSMFQFVTETKAALEQIINNSSGSGDSKACSASANEKSKKGSVGEALGRSLKNALHMRELMKLRSFHERVTVSFMNLMHKKENFSDMNLLNKNRSVAKNLEQLIEEIPTFLLRIEELRSALDEKLTWKEWKYLFKLGTSKVAWVLSRLVCHKSTLQTMITHICDLVNREQFTRSLVQVGLLDPPAPSSASTCPIQGGSQNNGVSASSSRSPINSPTAFCQLGMVESLCRSPAPLESSLAKNAVRLFNSGEDTDMCFEIVTAQDSVESLENASGETELSKSPGNEAAAPSNDSSIIKAHRVIIAARCDWFRKALLSGMKESIDKKIVIHDSNPTLFQVFLVYLYGGQVDTKQLSTEQLADLMQLSDRYEVDSLKQISEEALKDHIDEDSALFLLSIADQFSARSLRTRALEFIALNKDIIKSEVFHDLPEDLQSEVEEMITWVELRNSQRSEERSCPPQYLGRDSPSSVSSSPLDIEEFACVMNISNKEGEAVSDSSSLEDLPLTQDSAQLEACVAQLRDIVGETVAREELVRIALAADYDVNRALNFFFS